MEFIEEIKIHKNKETQRFRCQVLHREQGYLVLQYKSAAEGRVKDIIIEKGATTIAHYWQDRGYVLWRMFDAAGNLIGTLFHICKDIQISEMQVTYLDLIVDIWISPDGTIRVLDEDELTECKNKGLLSNQESDWIESQKAAILENYQKILEQGFRIDSF